MNRQLHSTGTQYQGSGTVKVPPAIDDLARRRTKPLLDYHGVSTRPLGQLLKEAWRLGFADAVDSKGPDATR